MLLDDLARDLRFGARTLARMPSFALTTVLTLGLGIGAATAVFSVVYGVLLRPLPYPEPDRIVWLNQLNADGNPMGASEPNFMDWKEQSRSFSALAEMSHGGEVSVLSAAGANRARLASVSREFFDVMQVRPRLGRAFLPEEQQQGEAPVAIVSDDYWRGALGASPSLAGQTLTLEQNVYQVVGVLPPGLPLGGESYPNGQFIEMTSPDEITSFEEFRRLMNAKERTGFAGFRVASEDYFRTMGIPLVRGRGFEPGDAYDAAHVAVISESFARTRWPNQDPIGRFIQFGNMGAMCRGCASSVW